MRAQPEVVELTDGLGFQLRIEGDCPLDRAASVVDALCRQVGERGGQHVVVLRLAGVPADSSWPGAVEVQQVNRWERALRRLERLTAANIGVAEGTCGGPALDLLLAADYRIATADLRLLLPVNEAHFWPGMAMYRLVAQLGMCRARQLVLWGHEILADRALATGLVDEVARDPEEAVQAATVFLGRLSGRELAVRRQLLLEAHSTSYEEALGAHLAACDRELRRVSG
ncbi:enoyl-CoA-hydratase DpgB [Micromonospora sp. LOL_024]|uniref:enoyl-CoA-hydratase DpgB n=1 Tax=Micromonospora sp. LOL_024 TaxID=3345412 RepID=UPI003A88997B